MTKNGGRQFSLPTSFAPFSHAAAAQWQSSPSILSRSSDQRRNGCCTKQQPLVPIDRHRQPRPLSWVMVLSGDYGRSDSGKLDIIDFVIGPHLSDSNRWPPFKASLPMNSATDCGFRQFADFRHLCSEKLIEFESESCRNFFYSAQPDFRFPACLNLCRNFSDMSAISANSCFFRHVGDFRKLLLSQPVLLPQFSCSLGDSFDGIHSL